jgi:hypothetical protein
MKGLLAAISSYPHFSKNSLGSPSLPKILTKSLKRASTIITYLMASKFNLSQTKMLSSSMKPRQSLERRESTSERIQESQRRGVDHPKRYLRSPRQKKSRSRLSKKTCK